MNDLAIHLDAHSSTPMYEQIYSYIKNEIQNGGLPFKERLPSSRKLAEYLQVSRTTVNLAYDQLVAEGYLEAVPQKGYFVCDLEGLVQLAHKPSVQPVKHDLEESVYAFDFSPHGVDLNSFPHNAWRKLSKELLMEEDKYLFRLGDPQGEPELRSTIAEYLHQARGVNAQPERIVVGAGNDFLLLLLCSMFGSGTKIAMESPTYRKAYDLFRNLSNDMRIVEMDEDGMRVDELEKTDAQLAYVMPSHQYPLGTVMPVKRRMQLLSWAAGNRNVQTSNSTESVKDGNHTGNVRSESFRRERYIIEDDYDSEFRYRGKPIPALQGYDRDDRVIYIGTFSRSIAPSIRVSYMVLPQRLMPLYQSRARNISSTVSRVDQMLIAGFLNQGYYERHLNRMRAVYRSRHDALLEELRAFRSICRVSGENAGVHLLLTFTNGMTEEEAVQRAAGQGVRIYGLSGYYVRQSDETVFPPAGNSLKTPDVSYVKTDNTENKENTKNTESIKNTDHKEHTEHAEQDTDCSDRKCAMPQNTVLLGFANLTENEIHDAAARLRKAWLE